MREDWIESNLGVLSEIFPGVGFPRDKQGKLDGQFPFYKVGDISKNVQAGNRFLELCDNYIDTGDIPKIENKILPPNTITFAKIGEALKLNRRCITKEYSLVDNNAIGVKANESLNDLFLYFYLLTIRLENYSRATTVPSVRKTDIENIRLPLPPLPEQRAIVAKIEELFSDLDKGIADLKKAQDQLKVYRQAVLKKAFEGELTKEWREQQTDLPTADELLEQIKEERQKHFEQQLENWKQAVKVWEENGNEGKKPGKPKNLIRYPKINQGGKLPILNLGEITFQISKKLMPDEAPNLTFIGMDCLEKDALKPHFTYKFNEFKSAGNWFSENHVLYGRLRPYLNKVYKAEHEGVASGEFIILETISSILPNYLKLILHQQEFVHWSNKQSSGDKPRVKFDQIALYKIKVPAVAEQKEIIQEIESRLSVCEKVEESITESLEKAKALRQSILKKAFEGALLSEAEIAACKAAPDYEPASVLLEKIKENKKIKR